MKCTTCGIDITAEEKSSRFPCPDCGEVKIGRCRVCKKLSREYNCTKCGFVGP